jgi:death-on-curing protein
MQYLTTHDLVWVNELVTGQVVPYNYVTLEAAMAGQYRYGQSRDVPAQAAVLLERLLFKSPFARGNRRTAFVSLLTFLNANGYASLVDDVEAAAIVLSVEAGQRTAAEAVALIAAPAADALPSDLTLRKLITHEFNLHTAALRALTPGD